MLLTLRLPFARRLRRSRLGTVLVDTPALLGPNGYLHAIGWLRTARTRSALDGRGRPIPTLSYPAIDFLESRASPTWRVFEYGSGASTLWWAVRVKEVVAVEGSPGRYHEMKQVLPGNAQVIFRPHEPAEPYATTPLRQGGGFDVVVADRNAPIDWLEPAIEATSAKGVIVADETHGGRFAKSLAALEAAGFRRLTFCGLAPISAMRSRTVVFYRDGNCLGI